LKCAISTHNFLKSEWIHSRKTTIRPKSSIFPNVCHHKRQHFEHSCTWNQMSVFDRRPLRTNICKYVNFIPLFSSHWTICTVTRTWQKLLCWGATFHVWSVAVCFCSPRTPPRHSRFCLLRKGQTMNASVLWDIVSRAKIGCHEAAGRVVFYLARDAISHRTRAFIV